MSARNTLPPAGSFRSVSSPPTGPSSPPSPPRTPSDRRFSERTAHAREPSKKLARDDDNTKRDPSRAEPARGMLLLGDGAFLSALGLGHAKTPTKQPSTPSVTAPAGAHAALEALRTGRGEGGASYLHATVTAGEKNARFAGVELRAVEQHGRVTIQLAAPDASSELALRATLAELRASLSARGLDRVHVELAQHSSSSNAPHDGRDRGPDRGPEPAPEPDEERPRATHRTRTLAPPDAPDASDSGDCW